MSIPKIMIPADRVVIVTENYSGNKGGECLLCGEKGWLDGRYGFPAGSQRHVMANRLVHTRECEMSRLLDDNGKFK